MILEYYALDDEHVNNIATGYTYAGTDGSYRRNNTFLIPIKGMGFGGLFTTVGDMLKFSQALLNHKLISKKYLTMAFSAKVQMSPNKKMNYGYGFGIDTTLNTPIVGHPGEFPGVSDNFQILMGKGYTVIILMNYDGIDGMDAMTLSKQADAIILGRPLPKRVSLTDKATVIICWQI